MKQPNPLHRRIVAAIKSIPKGRVATYGQIARQAGNPRAARQVAYVLHASSSKEHLPWHRVVNNKGGISLKKGHGYERQKHRLQNEGIVFSADDKIDLHRYGYIPG